MMYERYPDQPKAWEEAESARDDAWEDIIRAYIDKMVMGSMSVPSVFVDFRTAPIPDPPDLPVEKSAVPLVGYRSWLVASREKRSIWTHPWVSANTLTITGDDLAPGPEPAEGPYRLWSPVQGTEWTGPILRADGKPCAYDPHEPYWSRRDDHCHGIYAHDEPEWDDYHAGRAIGRLEATGTVVVHERGFRAEAVRIIHLVLAPGFIGTDAKRDLERIYGCDVTYNPEDLISNGHR